MTDAKALIAEAKRAETDWTLGPGEMRELASRLAAALEEAQVPEEWRVTELTREDCNTRVVRAGIWVKRVSWRVTVDGNTQVFANGVWEFPTAREAMAALDAEKAPPPG